MIEKVPIKTVVRSTSLKLVIQHCRVRLAAPRALLTRDRFGSGETIVLFFSRRCDLEWATRKPNYRSVHRQLYELPETTVKRYSARLYSVRYRSFVQDFERSFDQRRGSFDPTVNSFES